VERSGSRLPRRILPGASFGLATCSRSKTSTPKSICKRYRTMPNWSRRPLPQGWRCQVKRRKPYQGRTQAFFSRLKPACIALGIGGSGQTAEGCPRKGAAAPDATDPSPIASVTTVSDNPEPISTHLQADATPAKIDKSQLTFGEIRRLRDKAHLKFVASQPCLICGRSPARRPPSQVGPGAGNGAQGKRRVHSPSVQNPPPRQPQLRRRTRLVGEAGY
jgi:hypothetical protein